MKFFHLSDLHLGKRVNDFSMLNDQAFILDRILDAVDAEQPDAVLIAGDVYDKPIPPAEAVELLDRFLVSLSKRDIPVLLISGNHDSPERLAFASQLMKKSKIFISPVYNGQVQAVTLEDEFGPVDFFLLPFVKPLHLRHHFPEETIASYTEAVACAIRHMILDPTRRNVLLTHQFVTGAARCDSEDLSVGGSDNVDVEVFVPFDYVALGHLHGPQNVDGDRVRYCGTPLKYSFSEANHRKSITVVELGGKGSRMVREIPLTPLRDMLELRGSFFDLQNDPQFCQRPDRDAYLRAILTDEETVQDAMPSLRKTYPNIMTLEYDNQRTRRGARELEHASVEQSPLELFTAFYEQQNGIPLSEQQRNFLLPILEEIWEGSPS